jgi:hypothetical protein
MRLLPAVYDRIKDEGTRATANPAHVGLPGFVVRHSRQSARIRVGMNGHNYGALQFVQRPTG